MCFTKENTRMLKSVKKMAADKGINKPTSRRLGSEWFYKGGVVNWAKDGVNKTYSVAKAAVASAAAGVAHNAEYAARTVIGAGMKAGKFTSKFQPIHKPY